MWSIEVVDNVCWIEMDVGTCEILKVVSEEEPEGESRWAAKSEEEERELVGKVSEGHTLVFAHCCSME